MTWLMILQLLIVLGALWVGSRYGSLALRDRLHHRRVSPDAGHILIYLTEN